MPTCVRCDKWCAPSQTPPVCPECGGELRSGDALRRAEAKAATLGKTLAEYQQREKDERDARWAEEQRAYEALSDDEKEARAFRDGTYFASDDAFGDLAGYVISLVLAIATGAVLLVVSLLVGRSPLGVVGGTMVGVLGGAILLPLLYFGGTLVFIAAGGLVADHRTGRHFVGYSSMAVFLIVLLLPSLLTAIITLLLWLGGPGQPRDGPPGLVLSGSVPGDSVRPRLGAASGHGE